MCEQEIIWYVHIGCDLQCKLTQTKKTGRLPAVAYAKPGLYQKWFNTYAWLLQTSNMK